MAMQGLEMKFEGYDSLLNECVNQRALSEGQRVQSPMTKTQYLPPVYLRNRLIVLYTMCEFWGDAWTVFEEMPDRNVVSCYSWRGYGSEALHLFVKMLISVEFYLSVGAIRMACKAVEGILEKNIMSYIVMIRVLVLNQIMKSTKEVFKMAPSRDLNWWGKIFINDWRDRVLVVLWEQFVQDVIYEGLTMEFDQIKKHIKQKALTEYHENFEIVLESYGKLRLLKEGEELHALFTKCSFDLYSTIGSALVEFYFSVRAVEAIRMAYKVFEGILEKDIMSYTVMIRGLVLHKDLGLAMEVFKMVPDCDLDLWAGLVQCNSCDKVLVDFWDCIVDLYGKCGMIDEAVEVFFWMGRKDTTAYNTLIFNYGMHRQGLNALKFFSLMIIEKCRPNQNSFPEYLYSMFSWAELHTSGADDVDNPPSCNEIYLGMEELHNCGK